MIWVIVWVVCGFLGGMIGEGKGKKGMGWALGLLLGPIGVLIMAFVPEDKKAVEAQALATMQERKCPFCAELIKVEAKVCKHCGRDVPEFIVPKIIIEYKSDGSWNCPSCNELCHSGWYRCPKCGFERKDQA